MVHLILVMEKILLILVIEVEKLLELNLKIVKTLKQIILHLLKIFLNSMREGIEMRFIIQRIQ